MTGDPHLGRCLANFRHLRAFLAVRDLGSVKHASEQLYRAKSAITRSIHELEQALGVELFERRPNGMVCNPFGDMLSRRVARSLHEFAGVGLAAVSGKTGVTGAALVTHLPSSLFHESRLNACIAMAESENMPTAAQRLGVTQSAVSRSINDLERSLGASLFLRTAKGVLPTRAGKAFAFHVKRALVELSHVEADMAALNGTMAGQIRIGALPLGHTAILPVAIADVLKTHPRLRIATIEGPYEALTARLRHGDIDFILGALRPAGDATDLEGLPLLSDSMAVVVRTGHPLTRIPPPQLRDLIDAKWVLSNAGTPARQLLDTAFGLADLTPPAASVETSDLAVLRGILLHSDHVTAISPRQLDYEIGAGLLTVLDLPLPMTTRIIGVMQRADNAPSPAASVLIEAIRTHVDRSARSLGAGAGEYRSAGIT